MRKMRFFLTLFVLALSATSLHAQWSANVDAAGGFGMRNGLRTMSERGKPQYHYLGKGAADVIYKDSILTWKTSLSGSYESVDKDFLQAETHYGEDVTETEANTAAETIIGNFPDAEVSVVNGGQPVYYYMISAE